MKASRFMFGVIISITILAIMGSFVSTMVINYDKELPDKFNSSLQTMKETDQISSELSVQKEKTLNEDASTEGDDGGGFFDIVGFWLSNGIRAVKSTKTSFSLFSSMMTDGLDASSEALGIAYEPLRFMIASLLIIAITFIIMSALIKKDI